MDLDRHIVTVAGEEIDLTPTEFDLLRCLMQNPGYVFSRDELLEEAVGILAVFYGISVAMIVL